MLEDLDFDITEKQLEFLGQMPPRVPRGGDGKRGGLEVADFPGSS